MRLTVMSVGRLRPPFADDVAHYRKLLGRYARLELVEVRDDDALVRRVPADAYVSLLHVDGEQLDSVALSEFLDRRRVAARDVCFVVGGAFGLDHLDAADHKLSLGPLTLPHQLAQVVLLEQLYRAHKILAGEPYHH